tara:strand:- start:873 stop:2006 length:1134 start_codon:yes stop_codon:yes gene_type:complete
MVIGKLGEDYELAALQSSGISLLKIMKPIFLIVIVISSFSYIFSNYIMPIANFKGGSLLYDIKKKKPALNIKEGIFYNDIDGYSIKIETKSDNGNTLNNILIYDHTNNSGNKKVIIAESGNMNITNDERYMELNLFNGISYIEIEEIKKSKKNPHRKISFDKELIRFDLASFNIKNSELLYKGHYAMLNNQQLLNSIDSLKNKVIIKEKLIYSRLEKNYHYKQDVNQNFNNDIIKINKNRIYETAINKLRVLRSVCKSNSYDLEYKKKIISKHKIEWHRKISIAFSCIIMFLIGAPLGAIVRKGGFSIPLLMSIILFVIFYVTSIIGEKSAKDLIISPIAGMWMANIIFFPISIYLIIQALRNSSLPKIKDLIKLKA